MADSKRILIVDDNPQYRMAVARNLTLVGYQVLEAEDSDDGMKLVQEGDPHLIITDLDMRTHDEGLKFIQETKRRYPHKPIIMISAVGTFDEGALAQQYGATYVMSKSRIDSEIDTLYQRLQQIFDHIAAIQNLREQLDLIGDAALSDNEGLKEQLNGLLRHPDLDAGMKSEVYELIDRIERERASAASAASGLDVERGLENLRKEYPNIDSLNKETMTMLALAESMHTAPQSDSSIDRNVGFSYSFAVENEVKIRIGKKVNKLVSSGQAQKLANQLYDSKLRNLDIFFGQYLIRTVQQLNLELNADITRQVMERILQHGAKYKPDGLKSLGVILFCWGRSHEFANRKEKVNVQNPLGIKGLDSGAVTELADQLILLQHLRNPFIHPEFSEREQTESVRNAALACLSLISQVV